MVSGHLRCPRRYISYACSSPFPNTGGEPEAPVSHPSLHFIQPCLFMMFLFSCVYVFVSQYRRGARSARFAPFTSLHPTMSVYGVPFFMCTYLFRNTGGEPEAPVSHPGSRPVECHNSAACRLVYDAIQVPTYLYID